MTKPIETPPSERASVGKIARLPDDIRRELNLRLFNGQGGPQILPWLNELPIVKEILTAQFDGAPINDQNLSKWRAIGYQRWLKEYKKINDMEASGKFAAGLANAAGGSISRGLAAMVSDLILKFLDALKDGKSPPEDLIKFAAASAALLKGEQNNVRLKIAHERLRQRDEQLLLTRDKHQRDVTAIALRVLGDARAKAIEAADCGYAEKIEMLGRHLFGTLWEPRPIPPS